MKKKLQIVPKDHWYGCILCHQIIEEGEPFYVDAGWFVKWIQGGVSYAYCVDCVKNPVNR